MRTFGPSLLAVFAFSIASCTQPADLTEPPARAVGEQELSKEGAFQVKFETSAGDFVIEFVPSWSPLGVARVKELVEAGFYDECRFFRVVPDFVVQWGMNGDPDVHKQWVKQPIDDEPTLKSNLRGYVTFAKGGPDSRSTQLFISFKDNSRLDGMGFPAVGQVVEGMDIVESIYAGDREEPDQDKIRRQGNKYLNQEFPKLDYIKKATILNQ